MVDDIRKPAAGWNTWNVRSVLSHVLLPEGFAVSKGIKLYSTGCCLREALIGRRGNPGETVVPGPRSYDGTFTSLEVEWRGTKVTVETAVAGGDWFAVVTPLEIDVKAPALTISGAVLWNRPGSVRRNGDRLVIENGSRSVAVTASGTMRNAEPRQRHGKPTTPRRKYHILA